MTPTHSNRPIVRTRILSKQVSQGGSVLNNDSVKWKIKDMGKRFIIAILTIFITSLKFVVNMISIGISFITKKDIPLVGMISYSSEVEVEESIKYVVETYDPTMFI